MAATIRPTVHSGGDSGSLLPHLACFWGLGHATVWTWTRAV